jgi:recombination protein RecT
MAIQAQGTTDPQTAASRQLTPVEKKFSQMKQLLAGNMKAITSALPAHLKPERLARIVMTTLQKNPKLLECTQESFLGCVLSCAALGLEPDGLLGQAYLIPFRSKGQTICTLVPGYKGLMKLARQSGEIATIDAHEVCLGDGFAYRYGSDPMLKHRPAEPPIVEIEAAKDKPPVRMPDPNWQPGAITHFYAVAKMKDGTVQFTVMRKWEVDEIRDGSQGYQSAKANNYDHPWMTNYVEMGKKTAIRRGSKMWPASVDKDNLFHKVAAFDELQDKGITTNISSSVLDVDFVQAPSEESDPQQQLDEGKRQKLGEKKEAKPIVSIDTSAVTDEVIK